jgi:hypothetical protein
MRFNIKISSISTSVALLITSLSLSILPSRAVSNSSIIISDNNNRYALLQEESSEVINAGGIRYWLDVDPRYSGVYYYSDIVNACSYGGVQAGGNGRHCLITSLKNSNLRVGGKYWLDTDPRYPGVYYYSDIVNTCPFGGIQAGGNGHHCLLVRYKSSPAIASSKSFPLRGSEFTELGDHRRMKTDITISNNGRVDGVTRIWTAKQLQGFTGAAAVVLTDADGNVLYVTEPHSYGVNCKRCPGPSDRTQQWTDAVPSNIISQVKNYSIIHTTNPRDRWREWLRDAKEAAQMISGVRKEFK